MGKAEKAKEHEAEKPERLAAPLPDGRHLTLELLWRGGRIAALRLGLAERAESDARLSDAGRAALGGMRELIRGRQPDFSALPLDWDALTPFTRAVLEALYTRVPCGGTVSYGALAALAGQPGKARAVGGAMARNPWPLVVPCHRVLGAGGALTGYTNPHGTDLKALLLALESGRG